MKKKEWKKKLKSNVVSDNYIYEAARHKLEWTRGQYANYVVKEMIGQHADKGYMEKMAKEIKILEDELKDQPF